MHIIFDLNCLQVDIEFHVAYSNAVLSDSVVAIHKSVTRCRFIFPAYFLCRFACRDLSFWMASLVTCPHIHAHMRSE